MIVDVENESEENDDMDDFDDARDDKDEAMFRDGDFILAVEDAVEEECNCTIRNTQDSHDKPLCSFANSRHGKSLPFDTLYL